MRKLPRTYFIAPNGIKIDIRGFSFSFKGKVDVTIKEPRVNEALTDELRSKGSVEVTFNYDEFKENCRDNER